MLLVDDDAGLVEVLTMALTDAGFVVSSARDGLSAWRLMEAKEFEIVVLDLVMPELDGLELCRRIRQRCGTPIVMLTSKADEIDKVLGLEMGADDYVTKPFSNRELIARMRAMLRRAALVRQAADTDAERLSVRQLTLDRVVHEVKIGDRPLALTLSEFELLWALAKTPGRALSREDLIDAVYGAGVAVTDRTIDTFVKRLRQKIRGVEPSFDEIETIRSVGYRYRA